VAIEDLRGDKRIVVGAPGDGGGNGLAAWFRGRGSSYTAEGEFTGAGQFGAAVGGGRRPGVRRWTGHRHQGRRRPSFMNMTSR